MGTFYWKSRRRWAAQVTMSDGHRATATCHHAHRAVETRACQESRDLLAELERLKESQAPANARTLTLGKFLTRWLDDVKPSIAYSTWRKHESICRVHILPALGHVRLSDLSVSHVNAIIRGQTVGAQSRRHLRASLRRALSDAQRQGLVTRNVAALALSPRLPHSERPILNAEQARALIEGTRDDRYHALYVLAVTTGMRSAELLGLTWDDLDLSVTPTVTVAHTLVRIDRTWKLGAPKTDKSRRTIPLTPVAVDALREHRKRQLAERMAAGHPGSEGLVFTTPSGKPVWGSNILPMLRAHLTRLGLPKVGLHDLRHSAATVLFAQGIPLEVISDMLGHATTRITSDLYRHRVPALSVEAARRMQEAVGG
jgi:integrase